MGKGHGMGCGKGFGVQDLGPQLRDASSTPQGSLSRFKGHSVAVDISHTLHQAMRTQRAANQYHARPEVAVTAIIPYLCRLCDAYDQNEVVPIMVFDGLRHANKSRVNEERAKKAADAAEKTPRPCKNHDRWALCGACSLLFVFLLKTTSIKTDPCSASPTPPSSFLDQFC